MKPLESPSDTFHAQRSVGEVRLTFGPQGVVHFREAGSTKLRLPKGAQQAILINTSGGLAGGDKQQVEIDVEEGASLALTSQAAERVYRSLGPAAQVTNRLKVAAGASLSWLPQETILYEGSSLSRRINVELEDGASFIGLESIIFGRAAMGEILNVCHLQDSWDVKRAGKLMHAERLKLGPHLPRGAASLGSAQAMATLICIAPDVEQRAKSLHPLLAEKDGFSCWNGKGVARLVDEDGYSLKKRLARAVAALSGGKPVPHIWAF
ncbi:urease accessory protein UreD [Aestuariivirga litoralis]|uniref:urease accessory protein UreD n=1 Tax=Aestuariivirga litoralis TaxID=2650924 RepID=UPI0018C8525C|nr:urease accessory protein UreD [Aestuariivirga litoralis]MBG1232918.1 urease accessory protein UreD [Aestuariivirga litoralis]